MEIKKWTNGYWQNKYGRKFWVRGYYKILNVKENKLIECACGCGQKLMKFNKWGYKRKYINGHQNKKGKNSGKKHPNWTGEKVTYRALHKRIRKNKPKPKFCEECNLNSPFDVANISGKYKTTINDYQWLCRSCHMKKDGINKKEVK